MFAQILGKLVPRLGGLNKVQAAIVIAHPADTNSFIDSGSDTRATRAHNSRHKIKVCKKQKISAPVIGGETIGELLIASDGGKSRMSLVF